MKKTFFLSFSLILGLSLAATAQDDLSKPIPMDPSVRTGVLANGLTYFIKKNGKPEKRCELRLALNAGSMLETDEQQGLAHFVEHMCFNGTKNFKKSALVDFLETAGVKFGAHLNAYTSFDETVYMLQLPTDKEDVFLKGFQVLEDWAHNVTFDAEEIEKERGVVISERRGRLGASERMRQQYWSIMFEGSRYADRLPIGQLNVLQNFKRETLVDFYEKWYRPDLMAVMAVGDFDVNKVEALIKTQFGAIPSKPNAPKRESFSVPDHKGLRVAVASDAEATQTSIQVGYEQPKTARRTLNDIRQSLVAGLFNQMLGARFRELIQKGGTPFSYASSGYGGNVRTKNAYTAYAGVKETDIIEGLKLLMTENERVKRFGFNADELERVKKTTLTIYEKSYKERDKTLSSSLIGGMVNSFLTESPISGIDFNYEFNKKILPTVTLEEVNALAQKWISEKGDNAMCTIQAPRKDDLKLPNEADIHQIFDEYIPNLKLEPLKAEAAVKELMTSKPTAGKIVKETKNAALDFTEWTLSNGVKVVFKTTNFKNDEVIMDATSFGGYTLYPESDDDNGGYAAYVVSQSGIANIDAVALERFMSDKIVRVSPYISELTEGFSGSFSPKDAETAFQMVHLFFTSPRKDEKMFQTIMQQQRVSLENARKNPDAAFRDTITAAMYGNHPRRQPSSLESLDKINFNRSFEIYKDRFGDAGDFTFYFVGNIDEKIFRPMVEQYLASLPSKGRKETWKDPKINVAKGPLSKNVVKGIEPKSTVRLTYVNDFKYTRHNVFDMNVLVKLLSTKLREKIREEKGGTYGVSVSPSVSKFPKEEYQITISFGCAPEKADELMAATLKEVEDVIQSGADEKNLVKIKETFLRERETELKENRFWLNYISASQYNNLDVMDINKYNAWVNALTTKDFKKLAKKYIKKARLMQFTLKPNAKA